MGRVLMAEAQPKLVNVFKNPDILFGGTQDDGAERAGYGRQEQKFLERTIGQGTAGERHAGSPRDGRRLLAGWGDSPVWCDWVRPRSVAGDSALVPAGWPDTWRRRRLLRV